MFGIGIPELILIAFVALLVVGPKNLPVTLRALGRGVREFRKASLELRREAGFDEVVDEVTRPLREGLAGIEEDLNSVKRDVMHEEEDTSMEYPEAGPDDYGALPENAMYYPEDTPMYEEAEAVRREAEAQVASAPSEVAVSPVTPGAETRDGHG